MACEMIKIVNVAVYVLGEIMGLKCIITVSSIHNTNTDVHCTCNQKDSRFIIVYIQYISSNVLTVNNVSSQSFVLFEGWFVCVAIGDILYCCCMWTMKILLVHSSFVTYV